MFFWFAGKENIPAKSSNELKTTVEIVSTKEGPSLEQSFAEISSETCTLELLNGSQTNSASGFTVKSLPSTSIHNGERSILTAEIKRPTNSPVKMSKGNIFKILMLKKMINNNCFF